MRLNYYYIIYYYFSYIDYALKQEIASFCLVQCLKEMVINDCRKSSFIPAHPWTTVVAKGPWWISFGAAKVKTAVEGTPPLLLISRNEPKREHMLGCGCSLPLLLDTTRLSYTLVVWYIVGLDRRLENDIRKCHMRRGKKWTTISKQ